jgi:hypothetical protein
MEGSPFYWYKDNGDAFGRILYYNDTYPGFTIEGSDGIYSGPVTIRGSSIKLIDYTEAMNGFYTWGSKYCAQITEDYGVRGLHAVESADILYYDRGVINLTNGEATVSLDPIFLQCIEPDTELTPWQFWVECYGENGVYVSEVGKDYFKVKERNNGVSNNKVVWRFEAVRKNYAGIRLLEVLNE